MSTPQLSEQVKDHLRRGDTGEALAVLDAELQPLRRFHDQLIMLQAQYYECQRDERVGTIDSEEAQLRENRINNAILSLLREIEEAGGLLHPAARQAAPPETPPASEPERAVKPVSPGGEQDIAFEPKQLFVWNDPDCVMHFKRVFARRVGDEIVLTFELRFVSKKTSSYTYFNADGPVWRLFDDQGEFVEPSENNIPNIMALTAEPGSVVFRFPAGTRIVTLGLFYMKGEFEKLQFPLEVGGDAGPQ